MVRKLYITLFFNKPLEVKVFHHLSPSFDEIIIGNFFSPIYPEQTDTSHNFQP